MYGFGSTDNKCTPCIATPPHLYELTCKPVPWPPMPRRVHEPQRVIVAIAEPIPRLGVERVGDQGVGLDEAAQMRIIVPGVIVIQPGAAVKSLAGEEPIGEGDGQGAGDDLPIGVVLHPPHRLAGVIAEGHGAAQVILVDVVEAAVHAGGDALAGRGCGKRKPSKASYSPVASSLSALSTFLTQTRHLYQENRLEICH